MSEKTPSPDKYLRVDFSETVHKELYIGSYRKSLPQFKATMPPHKWVDNAELSVPDQMTNITEKTRLQVLFAIEQTEAKHTGSVQHTGFYSLDQGVYVWDCSRFLRTSKTMQT